MVRDAKWFVLPVYNHLIWDLCNYAIYSHETMDVEECIILMNNIVWDGRNASGQLVAAGVYIYKLESAIFKEVKKVTLIR